MQCIILLSNFPIFLLIYLIIQHLCASPIFIWLCRWTWLVHYAPRWNSWHEVNQYNFKEDFRTKHAAHSYSPPDWCFICTKLVQSKSFPRKIAWYVVKETRVINGNVLPWKFRDKVSSFYRITWALICTSASAIFLNCGH